MSASSDARSLAHNLAERAVMLPKHLHARPAGKVAQAAARHRPASIELIAGARRANAGSILALLALGAVQGTEVLVKVEGPDAAVVADDICRILEAPEHED
jgi:phosphocarrier protein HPr